MNTCMFCDKEATHAWGDNKCPTLCELHWTAADAARQDLDKWETHCPRCGKEKE